MNVSRKVRDNIRDWVHETQLMRYINIFRNSMWPDGKLRGPAPPRTTEEKIKTRDDANRKLSSLVPGRTIPPYTPVSQNLIVPKTWPPML